MSQVSSIIWKRISLQGQNKISWHSIWQCHKMSQRRKVSQCHKMSQRHKVWKKCAGTRWTSPVIILKRRATPEPSPTTWSIASFGTKTVVVNYGHDLNANGGVLSPGVFCLVCNFRKWIPTFTGGACYFKSGYLTSSLPGRVLLGNVTKVVFRSTSCSQRLFCVRTGLVILGS